MVRTEVQMDNALWVTLILLLVILTGAEKAGAETHSQGDRHGTTPRISLLIIWAYFHHITGKW